MKPALTAERLRELLHYDPETGVFTWRVPVYRKIKASDPAGATDSGGYLSIGIEYKKYRAHRLAWLYTHGEWPEHEIDHINGQRDDNRLANLRDVPPLLNKQNRKNKTSTARSGLAGAYKMGGRWRSQVSAENGVVSLGGHDTPEAAHAAFLVGKRRHQPGSI